MSTKVTKFQRKTNYVKMYLYKVYNIASFDVLQGICTLIIFNFNLFMIYAKKTHNFVLGPSWLRPCLHGVGDPGLVG